MLHAVTIAEPSVAAAAALCLETKGITKTAAQQPACPDDAIQCTGAAHLAA